MAAKLARLRGWLAAPENRHWKLALWWPIYVIAYSAIGHLGGRIPPICTSLPLDYRLPYLPGFIIPYLLWFPFWVGTLVYGLVCEPKLFRRTMHFFMLTFTAAVFVFWLFPTTTGLRPEDPGSGPCALLVRFVYWIDADANVCPSEHIVGLFAVLFAVWDSKRLSKPGIKLAAVLVALIIAASTVLVKQHAVLDLAAAVVLSLVGWLICFRLPRGRTRENDPGARRDPAA